MRITLSDRPKDLMISTTISIYNINTPFYNIKKKNKNT